ncbi:MAG TPA: sulfotransferase [Actinopolymorphaceae bacterium]
MNSASPVFAAGTGRSGTSQLADITGQHPQIHRVPIETRFLVDPGGFRDLADALTIRFDPYVGDDALRRLSDILTVRLLRRIDVDRGHTVSQAIGERHYWDAVGRLWSELVVGTFEEEAPAAGFGHADWPAGPFEQRSRRRAIPRYFEDRAELIAILRRAVDTMFGAAADAGKPTWREKTPFNLVRMDFLWELVPEATIVHLARHPVAVVVSHLDQPWAPSTVDGVLAWLEPLYRRWLAWKAAPISATGATSRSGPRISPPTGRRDAGHSSRASASRTSRPPRGSGHGIGLGGRPGPSDSEVLPNHQIPA